MSPSAPKIIFQLLRTSTSTADHKDFNNEYAHEKKALNEINRCIHNIVFKKLHYSILGAYSIIGTLPLTYFLLLIVKRNLLKQFCFVNTIILHIHIDHSIHSLRIWVNEQSKLQSSQWIINIVFQLLDFDVKECLKTLSKIDLRNLPLLQTDILLRVCLALRAKLISEINVNIVKLKGTSEVCINILSSVCRTLSLANFSLCFPPRQNWQQTIEAADNSAYVSFILERMFLPALKATKEMSILELILKLICEAWIDYIYSQKIKFTAKGALRLLNDFDEVKVWISSVDDIPSEYMNKLINHEVLRMCKGVGMILVRKPKEMISVARSPKSINKSFEETSEQTQLPSELFVSNQIHWLQLRASSNKLPFSICCFVPENY